MDSYDWLWCPKAPEVQNENEESVQAGLNVKLASPTKKGETSPRRTAPALRVGQDSSVLANLVDLADDESDSEILQQRVAPKPSPHPSTMMPSSDNRAAKGGLAQTFNAMRLHQNFLEPDPILKLSRVIGFSGGVIDGALWATSGDRIVYPCDNAIIMQKLSSHHQQVLMSHSADVSVLCSSPDRRLLVSGQSGASSFLCLWDFEEGTTL